MAVNQDADWVTLGWAETLDKKKQKQGEKRVESWVIGTWADYGGCISAGSTRYNRLDLISPHFCCC
jgi:hypothetical protein